MSNELDKFLHRNIDKVLEWQSELIDMIDQPHKYGYADNLLRGILEYIETKGDITEGQIQAIKNVKNNSGNKHGARKRNFRGFS